MVAAPRPLCTRKEDRTGRPRPGQRVRSDTRSLTSVSIRTAVARDYGVFVAVEPDGPDSRSVSTAAAAAMRTL